MSAAEKAHRTEIKIKEEGEETKTFFVPSKAAHALAEFLKSFLNGTEEDEEGSVPAGDVFPELNDPAKVIGIRFRSIRKKNDLTQEQVATRLGLDQADVSKIESGKRPIGKELAKKIQDEFGIDYRTFL